MGIRTMHLLNISPLTLSINYISFKKSLLSARNRWSSAALTREFRSGCWPLPVAPAGLERVHSLLAIVITRRGSLLCKRVVKRFIRDWDSISRNLKENCISNSFIESMLIAAICCWYSVSRYYYVKRNHFCFFFDAAGNVTCTDSQQHLSNVRLPLRWRHVMCDNSNDTQRFSSSFLRVYMNTWGAFRGLFSYKYVVLE